MSLEKEPTPQQPKTPQDIISKIERFYRKPRTHEELIENIRILKEIPEDASDPKVIVKLGSPEKSHKFVLMEDEDGRKYLICLPIEVKAYHADIVEFATKLYGKKFTVKGGGFIHTEGEKLIVDGRSEAYGEAPKREVEEILKKKFPDLEIEARSLKEQAKLEREKRLKRVLESLKNDFQRAFYQRVLDEAIKLGCDYTKFPEQIGGREDLAYMIYSSENGQNFGFDTLYLGYRDKNNVVKIKAILRERWYIRIIEVGIEGNQIRFKYRIGSEEKELTIPLDKIEEFEMVDNLEAQERELVEMYKNMQEFYRDAEVSHGAG